MTHHDKKLQGGPNPLVGSGEQLDQSQDSAERKESVYNLRNMFKDVRPPSEGSGGSAPSGGKRRRSIGIFGLRRGSDPTTVTGGGVVPVAVQQPPPVLEELSQAENDGGSPKHGSQRVAEADVCQKSRQAKTLVTGEQPSSQGKTETVEVCVTMKDSTDDAKPGTSQNSAVTSAPSSLPIQASHTMKNPVSTEDVVVEHRDLFDPGPVQTSTPIAPMHASSMGIVPVVNANQPEHYVSKDYPVTQTPPAEAQVGSNPALISLGSSPLSLSKVRIPSSVSSLKTPTSPLSDASTLNSSGDTTSESMKLDLSKTPKTEKKRPGILKSPKPSPVESTPKVLSVSSPTGQPHDKRIHSLPSPKSPTPTGTISSHVTIVKASPDSKREFSVVTMVEEKESSASSEDKQSHSHALGHRSENSNINPSVCDTGNPLIRAGEDPRLPDGPSLSQDKDDMVEMEDIQDCKVTQAEDAKAFDKEV